MPDIAVSITASITVAAPVLTMPNANLGLNACFVETFLGGLVKNLMLKYLPLARRLLHETRREGFRNDIH